MQLNGDVQIEDLVRACPKAVAILQKFGIRCIRCGEPLWGTLEEAAREKGITDLEPVLRALAACSDDV